MGFLIGIIVVLGSLLGGFMAMGGYVGVLWQPWEYVIICGTAFGAFIIANPFAAIRDTGQAVSDAIRNQAPDEALYLNLFGVLYGLMREQRTKSRSEVEAHIDNPQDSALFRDFPGVLADQEL